MEMASKNRFQNSHNKINANLGRPTSTFCATWLASLASSRWCCDGRNLSELPTSSGRRTDLQQQRRSERALELTHGVEGRESIVVKQHERHLDLGLGSRRGPMQHATTDLTVSERARRRLR